jgi:hypothetical protein
MVTQTLRKLERNSLVARRILAAAPAGVPRVDSRRSDYEQGASIGPQVGWPHRAKSPSPRSKAVIMISLLFGGREPHTVFNLVDRATLTTDA